MAPTLSRITIYPIKSLDGLDLESTDVLPSGALRNDRRFALVDADGRFVNGKRTAAVHSIRATYDLDSLSVCFNDAQEFSLQEERREIGQYLSSLLDIACSLTENSDAGFPDDTSAPGPTIISTATLREVAAWFPNLELEESRRRFRANLEIDGVEPFWEDRLFGPAEAQVPFSLGSVRWLGINPCQRCVVPSRDSLDGSAIAGFQKSFARRREEQLPRWATRDRFNHFYRLAVNTQLAAGQSAGRLSTGDLLSIAQA
jgi:hypothetical protein